ncbi:GTP-binding protein [Lampropedia puyangensis]|uniref:GTP-binding protein n=1 Tax=Lampropedia puyangensis TaxID=1330072 RepID=A0A4S8F9H7_9BURK|nr:ATP/GTP-binding protein [Lampropedia puyangensis]THU03671.1 GTP-binding protein [Lampropedia puyangensis]
MDWNIAVLGSVGSGKTTAIRTISDIDVVDTDVVATDAQTIALKETTTVAMDMGVMELGNGDKLRLHGAPGQDRFDFMWEILLEQAKGVVIFVDHSRAERLADLGVYLQTVKVKQAEQVQHGFPVVIAVTHAEDDAQRDLAVYQQYFQQQSLCTCSLCQPPVLWCDAREPRDVAVVLVVMTALLESFQLHPDSLLHERMASLATQE